MTMYGAPRPLKYNSDPVTRIAEQTCMGADPHRWAAPQVAAQVRSPPSSALGLTQAAQAATTCTWCAAEPEYEPNPDDLGSSG
eukprot:scaffold6772_cov33-Phaeocystis_antarctica.AAC.1